MNALYQTPTMMKILMDQGDWPGALEIYRNLKQSKPMSLDEELERRLSQRIQSSHDTYAKALEDWLLALNR